MLYVYLQSVINQSQDVLDCLLLGDVGHQVQKGLCTLNKTKYIYKLRKTQHACPEKLKKLNLKTFQRLTQVSKIQHCTLCSEVYKN